MKQLPALVGFIARDQYGTTLHLTSPKFPRKQLLAKLGRRSCVKQFCDRKDGTVAHTGYVCGSQWWSVYQVRELHA